jgi:hypothetical protein
LPLRVQNRLFSGYRMTARGAGDRNFFRSYAEHNHAYSRVEVGYMAGLAGLYAAADDVLYRVEVINIGLVLDCVFVFCNALFGGSWLAGLMFVCGCLAGNRGVR